MSDVREALIVAGGAGTRLRPLTATTPKPLLPFCNAPFLEGVVRRLVAVGVERVLLVVGADTRPFDDFAASVGADLAASTARGVTIETVPEPEPLDTAGGVRSVLDQLTGTFLVLNGDILTDVDLAAVVRTHHEAGADATLVLTRVEETSSYGVCVRDGSRIVDFVEKPAPGTLPGQDTINAGTYVLEPEAMARFPEGRLSFERQVFPGLVASGAHVESHVGEGVWADLGTPSRFLAGHRTALDGALSWPSLEALPADARGVRLDEGVHVADDAVLHGPLLLGRGTRVGAGAELGPYVVLGEDVQVGAGVRLSDSVVFDRVHLGEGVHASGLLAGTAARIDDDASLGREVVLGDGEQVAARQLVAAGTRQPDPGTKSPA